MKTNVTTTKSVMVFIFLSLFLTVGASLTTAQESTPAPSPTPENEEIKKLKDQIELLKLQSEKATLEKTLNDTQFPKPSTTPLAGDTTIDTGVKIETEMMAYRALSNASALVANDVTKRITEICNQPSPAKNYFAPKDCAGKKIAILNSQWLNGLRGYWAAKNQLRVLDKSYDDSFNPPAPPAVFGVYNRVNKGFLTLAVNRKTLNNDSNVVGLTQSSNKTNATPSGATPTSADNSNKFYTASLSFIPGAINGVTGIAGAAIDLLALMRTDTKISGSSYTIQESAFVSQVYRELGRDRSKNLFYPVEFSPNINLNKEFVILGDIQNISEMRAKGEQIVVGIEEVEKGIKETTATKTTLEERQKVLPDELAAVKEKMRDLEKSFPNAAKRPRDVIIDLNDLAAKQKALLKESNELSGKLKKAVLTIAELEKKRDALYSEIKQAPAADQVINGFVDLSYELDRASAKYLNRNFTVEEVEGLSYGLTNVKRQLAEEAKTRRGGRELTEEEKAELFSPIDGARLKIFVKVVREMLSKQVWINELEPNVFLTTAEQLKLSYKTDELAGVEGKVSDRQKTASLNKLKTLNKQFDKFMEDAVKVDEKLGASPIIFYLQSESIMDALGCDLSNGNCADAFALSLRVIDAGGNNRTKKNLWTMAVAGDDVSHSGGAIVEYKLYDMAGVVKTSSICRAYESYRKPGNINKTKQRETNKADCEAQPLASNVGNRQQ